jgi:DNA-binding response OmpR family regulator
MKQPFKVLVIDDDRALQRLYEWELGKEGYSLAFADAGWEGVQMARTWRPDLVILDIVLAGMDGVSTLSRLLEDDAGRPVVINSAHASYRENFMTWAADAYLTKSSDLSDLKDTVRFLLEETRRAAEGRRGPYRGSRGVDVRQRSETYVG